MPKRKPKDPDRCPDLPHQFMERQIAKVAAWIEYQKLPIDNWEYRSARMTAPLQYVDVESDWRPIKLGDYWGGNEITGFFRRSVQIPATHAVENCALDIWMDGGETQVSINGIPWQGLDWNRHIIPLGDIAADNDTIEVEMEAYVINYPYDARRDDERDLHLFERAQLVLVDPVVEQFTISARMVLNVIKQLWESDENIELEEFLSTRLEKACISLGPGINSQQEAVAAAGRAMRIIEQEILDSPLYRSGGRLTLHAHSHLDVLYLWPMKETFRKNCRTVTNMLSLMREYPDFIFSQSQPFLYEKLKLMYPETFEELKKRVAEGRWELIGAPYIEPDANLPGAESLVRQLLFGKRFYREEFGIDVQICLLPDVFGLMYTLPQILKKAGVPYFISNKLNIWNDTTVFPYDNFRWRGPDGSEVLAHFPSTHFAQDLNPETLRRAWRDSCEKNISREAIFMYGYGDGGGGPTREMAAAGSIAGRIPGLPELRVEFAADFMERLSRKQDQLPVWDDELYLEAHRGTYTTKALFKRMNRKTELLYRNAEIISSLASLYGGPYLQDRLNEGWKYLLVNQFHDTLPGSHCSAAVPGIIEDYRKANEIGEEVLSRALKMITDNVALAEDDFLLFNTLSWQRSGLALLSEGQKHFPVSSVQEYEGEQWVWVNNAPSLGWAPMNELLGQVSDARSVNCDLPEVVTPFYAVSFSEDGLIEQIRDLEYDREVLAEPGNRFQVFEDDPGKRFSAWNIAYHLEEFTYPVVQESPWELKANGPLFAVIASVWTVLDSRIEQEIWFYTHSRRIDFKTRINWQNSRKMLKVAFPLKIRAREAVYDLPFGSISRPTHRNTLTEQAKYEVCGHKWADMSEGNYGAALMNDCKYGYDAKEHVLRLSLLRAPVHPDAQSDIGEHEFTYSLYPHGGTWKDADIDRRAYELNIPMLVVKAYQSEAAGNVSIPPHFSFCNLQPGQLITETLKQAEDGNGLIMRVYESHGFRGRVSCRFSADISASEETNLLEETIEPVEVDDAHQIVTPFTPFEIKTLRLKVEK
jgi:alpha-mannosidase